MTAVKLSGSSRLCRTFVLTGAIALQACTVGSNGAAGGTQADAKQDPTMGGLVSDTTGAPLGGAIVTYGGRTTVTNQAGVWTLGRVDDVTADTTVWVRKIGFSDFAVAATEATAEATYVRAQLLPVIASRQYDPFESTRLAANTDDDGVFELRVRVSEPPAPLDDVRVHVAGALFDGAASIAMLPGAPMARFYEPATEPFVDWIEPKALLYVDVNRGLERRVRRGEAVRTEIDIDVTPLGIDRPGFKLAALYLADDGSWSQRATATTEWIEIPGGPKLTSARVTLDRLGTWLLAWPYEQHACVRGRALMPDLSPAAGIELETLGQTYTGRTRTRTDAQGRFVAAVQRSTDQDVRRFEVEGRLGYLLARLTGGVAGQTTFVAPRAEADVIRGKALGGAPLDIERDCANLGDLRFPVRTVVLTGQLFDGSAEDRPVAGADVWIVGGAAAPARTDTRGRFRIVDVPVGANAGSTTVRLMASHPVHTFRTLAVEMDEPVEFVRMTANDEPAVLLGVEFEQMPLRGGSPGNVWVWAYDRNALPPRFDARQSSGELELIATDVSEVAGLADAETHVRWAKFAWTPEVAAGGVTFTATVSDTTLTEYRETVSFQVGDAAPLVRIVSADTGVRGQIVHVHIDAIDPEGAPLTFNWLVNGDCAKNDQGACISPTRDYDLPVKVAAGYSVQVDVSDGNNSVPVTKDIFGIEP